MLPLAQIYLVPPILVRYSCEVIRTAKSINLAHILWYFMKQNYGNNKYNLYVIA